MGTGQKPREYYRDEHGTHPIFYTILAFMGTFLESATLAKARNTLGLRGPIWDSSITYQVNDIVFYGGQIYVCIVSNSNVQPDSDDTKWEWYDPEFAGIVKQYNGSGIVNADTRTEQIGYHGSDTVPKRKGWYVCNGQSSTPDLRNKFIRCESASGNTGGSDDAIVVDHGHTTAGSSAANTGYTNPSHGHSFRYRSTSAEVASTSYPCHIWRHNTYNYIAYSAVVSASINHRHSMAHTHSVNNSGSSGTGANKPAYYSLIFIIKMS